MIDADTPMIRSSPAARRLKLLLGHGIDTDSVTSTASPVSSSTLRSNDTFAATLLPWPVSPAESPLRDVMIEIAVSPMTLSELKLGPGAAVRVANPDRPHIPPHLARVWPDSSLKDTYGDNTHVALAPSLAYNLGLPLHLTSVLHRRSSDTTAAAAASNGADANSTPSSHRANTGCRVVIRPLDEATSLSSAASRDSPVANGKGKGKTRSSPSSPSSRANTASSTGTHHHDANDDETSSPSPLALLSQPPPLPPAQLPIAREVHVAVIREPATGWQPPTLTGDAPRAEKNGGDDGTAAAAIHAHFGGAALRAVCDGDFFTARVGEPSVQSIISANLEVDFSGADGSSSLASQQNQRHYHPHIFPILHFRVIRVIPDNVAIQVVDPETTVVRMMGTVPGGIAPGMGGYVSPRPPLPSLLGWHACASSLAVDGGVRGDAMPPPSLPFIGPLMPSWVRIASLVAPLLHPSAESLPLRVSLLIHGPEGAGKRTAVAAAAAALGCHVVSAACREMSHPDGLLPEGKASEALKTAFEAAARYKPALLVLEDVHALVPAGDPAAEAAAARVGAALAAGMAKAREASVVSGGGAFPSPLIAVACTATVDDVPPALRRCFTHEIEIDAPDARDRERLLRGMMHVATGQGRGGDDVWSDIGRHTAGLLPRNLRSFAADACAAAALDAFPPETLLDELAAPGGRLGSNIFLGGETTRNTDRKNHPSSTPLSLGPSHIDAALNAARARMATDIGAPKIPDVRWDDVGGLDDVKAAILDTVELPLKHPELFSAGLRRRSGVLLYGPPGTGKTLLAKAVATECAVNFMSVKGPELINMYVGESERQVREVFARARRARPCVVFFDELDSLAPARGRGSDSGGVMDRVVSQLLAEIDSAQGGSGTDDVFIIGATNRPDLLDPALLRPGRLDKLLYVGVAGDDASQLSVIRALTRKFRLGAGVDLAALATACPPLLTGADLYAMCSDAWMTALKRRMAAESDVVGDGIHGASWGAEEVEVVQEDFEKALRSLRPSLHEDDMRRYEEIRDRYQQ